MWVVHSKYKRHTSQFLGLKGKEAKYIITNFLYWLHVSMFLMYYVKYIIKINFNWFLLFWTWLLENF